MAVLQLVEPTDDILQLAKYNSNIGGQLNRYVNLSVPADVAWAVVGLVLVDAATPESVVNVLIPAIEALAEVTSVNGNQLYGQIPDTIEPAGYEAVLHVSSFMTANIGSGDVFIERTQAHETVKPPVGKKWCVALLRLPSELDDTKIAALESALEGITGVTTAEHLIDGVTSDRQSGDAQFKLAAHIRIDSVEA
jgi:hypothetical protein